MSWICCEVCCGCDKEKGMWIEMRWENGSSKWELVVNGKSLGGE